MNRTTARAAMERASRRGVDLMSMTPRPLLTPQRRMQTSTTTILESALRTVRSARRATN
ncbi:MULTISPECIES: hypothetical protein [Mycobacteroides]|uniref:hypothetical protein n=1 Tax=Mycobacteroides TaxID=670516 RepID=UPI0012AB1384|nr:MULTISPECIES: hypothetical protein [Mycobacteroides]MBN7332987.1 hypothetical protein [Mycobacteroides abscessus subsp. abscessus]MBN7339786.1 hypothetical protein [Mycobacteroides abscessus subsp. massiliense]MBN7397560.1 hypothetical protein [Mycobacteroides abscessus subsp. abscessus]MBN7541849.1 hypothetical protein [Mycobacteroides abscessus subsp. massiliense]MDB2305371.1 hypothetical protein [Mycobacteroides abscessus subsp. massiliense]